MLRCSYLKGGNKQPAATRNYLFLALFGPTIWDVPPNDWKKESKWCNRHHIQLCMKYHVVICVWLIIVRYTGADECERCECMTCDRLWDGLHTENVSLSLWAELLSSAPHLIAHHLILYFTHLIARTSAFDGAVLDVARFTFMEKSVNVFVASTQFDLETESRKRKKKRRRVERFSDPETRCTDVITMMWRLGDCDIYACRGFAPQSAINHHLHIALLMFSFLSISHFPRRTAQL